MEKAGKFFLVLMEVIVMWTNSGGTSIAEKILEICGLTSGFTSVADPETDELD